MAKILRYGILIILGIVWLLPAYLLIVNAMKDLPDATTKGGMLYVFALP